MSGPVSPADTLPADGASPRPGPDHVDRPQRVDRPDHVDRYESRLTEVGGVAVRRALPKRQRRTIGAWCFVDHFGPTAPDVRMNIGPHPHIGLQTVTWLVAGEVLPTASDPNRSSGPGSSTS